MKVRTVHKVPDKHMEYYAFLDACRESSCPICSLLNKTADHLIGQLLYEEVNDPEVRKRLRESLGFCRLHALLMVRAADGFGTAIIYKDILEIIRAGLKNHRILRSTKDCPICTSLAEREAHWVGTVATHIQDDELKKAISASQGFCLDHLREVLRAVDGKSQQFVAAVHVEKFDAVIYDLGEFIRKHDYRFHGEKFTESEAGSWQRAVRVMVGGVS